MSPSLTNLSLYDKKCCISLINHFVNTNEKELITTKFKKMEYKGYLIEEDKSGYAPKHMRFSFYSNDGEKYCGSAESIEGCKADINELISNGL